MVTIRIETSEIISVSRTHTLCTPTENAISEYCMCSDTALQFFTAFIEAEPLHTCINQSVVGYPHPQAKIFHVHVRNATERRKREIFGPGIYYRGISAHAQALPGNGGWIIFKENIFVHCCICSSNLSFSRYCYESSIQLVQRLG